MYRRAAAILGTCLVIGAAAPGRTHPHIYVDTALRLLVNAEGQATAVEVTWRYDDFYSLLIFEDRNLDPDADGVLTEEEVQSLQKWDLAWVEGFAGDLYLTDATGAEVNLGAPEDLGTTVTDGRIESRHRRSIRPATPVEGLTARAYDPEFYTAYALSLGVTVSADDCAVTITAPDQGKAAQEARSLMAVYPEDATDVPMLGHLFAETAEVRCDSAG
ncbi:DUF1007 family protein [Pseudooceanicola sp. C21-150M6]|uniref:DUF1007 family protein n=1 Tax=Pseudooceanicola sp. C21-150M6 TaxID=3434355 RepID=UPI003D7FF61C